MVGEEAQRVLGFIAVTATFTVTCILGPRGQARSSYEQIRKVDVVLPSQGSLSLSPKPLRKLDSTTDAETSTKGSESTAGTKESTCIKTGVSAAGSICREDLGGGQGGAN